MTKLKHSQPRLYSDFYDLLALQRIPLPVQVLERGYAYSNLMRSRTCWTSHPCQGLVLVDPLNSRPAKGVWPMPLRCPASAPAARSARRALLGRCDPAMARPKRSSLHSRSGTRS